MINLARGNQSFVICCNCNITDKLWFLFENMCIITIFYYQEHVELTYFKVMRPQFIKGILINKYNSLLWLYKLFHTNSLLYFSLGISSSDELLYHVWFSTLIRDDIYNFSSNGLCLAPLHTTLFPVFNVTINDRLGGTVGKSVRFECGRLGVQIPGATDVRHKNYYWQFHCLTLGNRWECQGFLEMTNYKRTPLVTVGVAC